MSKLKGFGNPKVRMATSKTKKAQSNKTKNHINHALARNAIKNSGAIVLDGPDMKTTKTLIRRGWRKSKIVNVNGSDDYHVIAKKHPNSHHCTMSEYLEKADSPVGLIYLDYMCTLPGNSMSTPVEDLNTIFEKGLLISDGVLAITLSARSKKDNDFFKYQDVGKLLNKIYVLGYEWSVPIELITGGVYENAGTMYSYVFRVK